MDFLFRVLVGSQGGLKNSPQSVIWTRHDISTYKTSLTQLLPHAWIQRTAKICEKYKRQSKKDP